MKRRQWGCECNILLLNGQHQEAPFIIKTIVRGHPSVTPRPYSKQWTCTYLCRRHHKNWSEYSSNNLRCLCSSPVWLAKFQAPRWDLECLPHERLPHLLILRMLALQTVIHEDALFRLVDLHYRSNCHQNYYLHFICKLQIQRVEKDASYLERKKRMYRSNSSSPKLIHNCKMLGPNVAAPTCQ